MELLNLAIICLPSLKKSKSNSAIIVKSLLLLIIILQFNEKKLFHNPARPFYCFRFFFICCLDDAGNDDKRIAGLLQILPYFSDGVVRYLFFKREIQP